jgi:hypothetical protein
MTPLVRKRLRQVEVLHRQEEDGTQDLIFSSRPFVLCGLPLRRPAKGTLLHTRRNGKFVLQVQAHPDYGLPFGQDRLIPIWVATLAVRQQSRSVRFRSATEILEEFGLPRNGKHYHRLIDGFKRVFTSTIYFGADQQVSEQAIWEFSRFAFFDHMRLWYVKKQGSGEHTPTDNIITLSEQFWDEVREHPIPADLNVVRALANAPGCLDLYLWLVWRCFKLKREAQIPLFGTYGFCSQLGADDYLRRRDLRRTILRWLHVIQVFWTDCPAVVGNDGTSLQLRPARTVHPRPELHSGS